MMGCFKKLYDPNYKETEPTKYGWTDNWSDYHDYFGLIDEGYLTIEQFILYNRLLKTYKDELTDDEVWSMTNSNDVDIYK